MMLKIKMPQRGAYSIGRLGNTNLIIASVCNSIVPNYGMIWD